MCNIMRAMFLVWSVLLAPTNCIQILQPTPNLHPNHVCPTFPFCVISPHTGKWVSQLENNESKSNITYSLEKAIKGTSSDCFYEEHYCRSDASDTIQKLSLDNAEECQAKCQEHEDCLYWTFHKTRGRGRCFLLAHCDEHSLCNSKADCASGPKTCGCQEIGPFMYDPNEEDGATFACTGGQAKQYKKAGGWSIKSNEICHLYCNNETKPFVSVFCDATLWRGNPERGFWCYKKPASPEPQQKKVQDPQCLKRYTTLSATWRQIRYGVKQPKDVYHCDKPGNSHSTDFTPGWHRFKFPSAPYATIPTTPPLEKYRLTDMQSCGTHAVSWMEGTLPVIGDPPKDVTIYFAYASNDKLKKRDAKVVACSEDGQTMFLYDLPVAPACAYAYCALKTIS